MTDKNSEKNISWESVEVVQKMQDFIEEHALDDEFCTSDVYKFSGYSQRHCERIFVRLTGKSISDYIRSIRLSDSAGKLLEDEKRSVLEIALDTNFETHEGYTRAFGKSFGITPSAYRNDPIAIPLFIQYPVRNYYSYLYHKEKMKMSRETMICMVTAVERPRRKLLIMRSKEAHDYWSFCEEVGCDWEGLFNSISEKMDTAAILELPEFLCVEGFSNIAAGVELPYNYDRRIPDNCELAELEACKMLYFQSEKFDKDEDFGIAINSVFKASDNYDAKSYGYEYDFNIAPKFNYGASKKMGAKIALPIVDKK